MVFRRLTFHFYLLLCLLCASPLTAQPTLSLYAEAGPPATDTSGADGEETLTVEDNAADQTPGATPRFQMDEVVVTATREEDVIKRVPRNVTVITAEDIAQAPGNNVVDLLAREANLNLQSYSGHDKNAGIDIRGMGATFVSNVIVLVDGFRLNPPDLAGPDYSSIPIDQIERIEIVRGAGSVLYGDGAVGGVVNIITKKGAPERETSIYTAYGSYETYDTRAATRGQVGDLRYSISSSYYDTDGYRDNNAFRKKDVGTHFDTDLSDVMTLMLGYSYHDDKIGLPGPVPAADNRSSRRKDTLYPDDFSETTEHRLTAGTSLDFDQWGQWDLQLTYRDRDNPYILGYNPLLSKSEQTDEITEDSLQSNLVYRNTFDLFGRDQRFICGVDFFYTDYLREEARASKKNRDMTKTEGFLQTEISLPGDVILSGGFRKSYYEGDFRDDSYEDFYTTPPPPPPIIPPQYLYSAWVRGDSETQRWTNEAWDVGLTWLLNEDTSLFASAAQSYRIPNVDELTLAADDLRPQEGHHFDVGLRTRIAEWMECTLTLFWIRIKDEIYYGEDPGPPVTQLNRNYDEKTRRRGIEVDLKAYPTTSVYLWGNFSYVDAEFEGSGDTIPLVPEAKGSVGLEYALLDPLTLALTGTFVGTRYDGNDQSNDQYDKLPAYEVFDAKLSYQYKDVKLFCGLNNIFDEKYTTVSYSEFIYPMPGRNGYVGVEWIF